jgi:hypothetical protein
MTWMIRATLQGPEAGDEFLQRDPVEQLHHAVLTAVAGGAVALNSDLMRGLEAGQRLAPAEPLA